MSQQQPTSSGSAFSRSVAGFFRFLVRFLFVLVIGALIGLGLYYGVPWAYRRLVLPVQENGARISILEQEMDLNQEHWKEDIQVLRDRIVSLETAVNELQETAAVQSQDHEALAERAQNLEARADQLESALAGHQQDVSEIQSNLTEATSDLSAETESLQQQLTEMQTTLDQRTESIQERVGDLAGRMILLQTAQDLLQVRLLLLEENRTLAREALALAVTHLDQASATMPSQKEALEGLRERMVTLDDLIARQSYRVRPDLEALWADLMDLIVPSPSQPAAASTSELSPVATPTPGR